MPWDTLFLGQKYHFYMFWPVITRHGGLLLDTASWKTEQGVLLASYSPWRAATRLPHNFTRHGEQNVGETPCLLVMGGSGILRANFLKQIFNNNPSTQGFKA
jgi:hypothetical protein